jgi:hypothetical protein
MLERQSAPVAIRNIVSVFKDRIHTERDKSEFKALCDKWTGVVEYPVGRWVGLLVVREDACGWHSVLCSLAGEFEKTYWVRWSGRVMCRA